VNADGKIVIYTPNGTTPLPSTPPPSLVFRRRTPPTRFFDDPEYTRERSPGSMARG
jgi:hypothetical protein